MRIPTAEADFWQDKEKAGEVSLPLKQLKRRDEPWESCARISTNCRIWGLAVDENDESLKWSCEKTWEGWSEKALRAQGTGTSPRGETTPPRRPPPSIPAPAERGHDWVSNATDGCTPGGPTSAANGRYPGHPRGGGGDQKRHPQVNGADADGYLKVGDGHPPPGRIPPSIRTRAVTPTSLRVLFPRARPHHPRRYRPRGLPSTRTARWRGGPTREQDGLPCGSRTLHGDRGAVPERAKPI